MNIAKTTNLILLLISVVFILIIGKKLFIPIVLASLVWFLVKDIRKGIQRTPFIGKVLPRWLLNIAAAALLFCVLGFVFNLLSKNISGLLNNMDAYTARLNVINQYIHDEFGFNIRELWIANTGEFDFTIILEDIANSLSSTLGNVFMIALYLLFMLLEESVFGKKILYLASSEEKKIELTQTLEQIDHSISKYISLKTLVSLITGFSSYLVLKLIGLDAPIFWAFLIFLLNFIPTIGSLIGTLFPVAMAFLQFEDPTSAIIILIAVGSIQVIVGNIIEPKIMGNSLNVSSLVVILSLSFWGAIWGITGMVLSVPITVILVILFSQFKTTRSVAILLSDKGQINTINSAK